MGTNRIRKTEAFVSLSRESRLVLRGDPYALAVYVALLDRVSGLEGEAFPTYTRIADDSGVCRREVGKAITRLEAIGLLERERRSTSSGRTSNLYTLFHSPPKGHSVPQPQGTTCPNRGAPGALKEEPGEEQPIEEQPTPFAADAESGKSSTSVAVAEQPKARKPNLPFDAIAHECGIGQPVPRQMATTISIAVRDIREVSPGLSDEQLAQEVHVRAGVFRKIKTFDLTPLSLAKYWTQCAMTPQTMRVAYSKMNAMDRLAVRIDLEEQGYTPEQIKEMTG